MSELYEKIEALCRQHGTNVTRMCREAGISRAPLSDLKMGRSRTLAAATLAKIAAHFGVTVDFLLGQEEAPARDLLDEVDLAFYGEYRYRKPPFPTPSARSACSRPWAAWVLPFCSTSTAPA